MKKRILLIAGLCLGSTGFAMADGIVFHYGLGYYISFLGTPIRVDIKDSFSNFGEKDTSVLKSTPLGLALFSGIGYGFGPEEKISVGGEGVLGMGMSAKPLGALHFFIQGRGFCRYVPFEDLSVAGFAGIKANLRLTTNPEMPTGIYPVLGVRAEYLFLYLEYGIVLRGNFSNVFSHDITIGGMLFG